MDTNFPCKYAGYTLFTKSLDELPSSSKIVINTINQYSFCMAEKQPDFKKALVESEILLPDGVGIVAAVKLQTGDKIKKISGSDLHSFLLDKLSKESGSCFYLGSSPNTLKKIKDRLAIEYPDLRVGFFSPPYRHNFTDAENDRMISEINSFKPSVLFIGMTAPKQEKWSSKFKKRLDANVIASIGAVFDFYAGTHKRPNQFFINNGFEWLGRLIHEPKRMWKRYLYYGPVFLYILIKYKLKN